MSYSIRMPDGTLVENIPDELSPEDAKSRIIQAMPQYAPKERTWGEAAKDIGAGAVSGIGSLVQLPGQLYGLATGNFEKTGSLGLGENIQKYGEEMKSPGLKAREAARSVAVQEAEKVGQWEAFKAALGETVSDPALLFNFLSEQAPQMIPAIISGGGTAALTSANVMAKVAARGISKEAAEKVAQKAAVKAGTTAGIQTAGVQQGADIGSGAYDMIYKELTDNGMSPEQAAAETINKARAAGASGYLLSLLAQRLPGGQAMERILAGEKLAGRGAISRLGTGVATAAKEIPGEMLEETGGRFSQNLAMREVKPEQSLTEGLGETAAMAALGAAGMGGAAGVMGRRGAEAPPPPAPTTETEQKKEEAPITPETEQKERSLDELFGKPPAPAAPPIETVATPEEQATLDALKAEYDRRAAEIEKLKAENKFVPPAKTAKRDQVKAEIDAREAALKARAQGAAKGETNVVQPDEGTSGTGAGLSAQSGTDVAAATATGAPESRGVVSARSDATTTAEGKGQPAAPVTEAAPVTTPPPAAPETRTPASFAADVAAGKKLTTPEDIQYYQNNATAIEEELKKLEVAPRPSKGEIKKEIAASEAQVGELYDLERGYGRFDDDTSNLYDSLTRGVLPDSMGFGTARLKAVLDRNKVQEPEMPDNYETLSKEEKTATDKAAIQSLAQALEGKRGVLPEWSALRADQRQVYLNQIRENTADEHAKAREALIQYRNRLREAQKEEGLEAEEVQADPAAGIYERNRQVYKTRDRIEYPTWNQLTNEQREMFRNSLSEQLGKKKSGEPVTDFKKSTAEQQDVAFKKVADNLVEEGYVPKPGMTYDDVRNQQLKQQEAKSYERAQKEFEEERKEREMTEEERAEKKAAEDKKKAEAGTEAKEEKIKVPGFWGKPAYEVGKAEESKETETSRAKAKPEDFIPDALEKQIQDGNLDAVMNWLSTAAPKRLHRAIALAIKSLKIKTTIRYVNSLPNGDIAQYDPKADEILVTTAGLKPSTLLHELVHAATVSVLDKYEKGNKNSLTPAQIEGVEHLRDLMKLAQKELGKSNPAAFKNIFEFVAYAMTDAKFQAELSNLSTSQLENTIMPESKSMLSKFMDSVLEIIGMQDLFSKKGTRYKENILAEVISGFEQIIAAPEGGVQMEPLPATAPVTKQAPSEAPRSFEEIEKEQKLPPIPDKHAVWNFMNSMPGIRRVATVFANSRYPIKVWEDALQRAKKIVSYGPKLNNIYTQITLSASRAKDLYLRHVNTPAHNLSAAIGEYAKASGIDTPTALKRLHTYMMALHEPERRLMKFWRNAPLSTDEITIPGTQISMSPADFRAAVFKKLEGTERMSQAEIKQVYDVMKNVMEKYVKADGYSPAGVKSTDINDSIYNVIGKMTPQEVKMINDRLKNDPQEKHAQKVFEAARKLNSATTELNKMSNYWSDPVQKLVDFYGWDNYIPFKGTEVTGKSDAELDFDILKNPKKVINVLQEYQSRYEGRETWSDNSLTQILNDATRASMRAGRRDMTLAIKNAIDSKLLRGDTSITIPFDEKDNLDVEKLKGKSTIFHYNKDGSINILVVNDTEKANAIHRTYQQANPIMDQLNWVTSKLGQLHTRYNVGFAPVNFFRDALTNAFNMSVDPDLTKKDAAQYLGSIAMKVAKGGMGKALKIARLYNDGKMEELDAYAAKDKSGFAQAMVEYLKEGGMVSYLQGLSAKGTFDNLQQQINSNSLKKAADGINRFFDIYTDMFELASRTAAYQIARDRFIQDGEPEQGARVRAAAYVKNLANFEQTGEWGRGAGAMFMFFRPAATGAVRAIEAIGPMLRSTESAVLDLPYNIREPMINGKKNPEYDAEAVEKFKENHRKQRKAAQVMTLALTGFGMSMYILSQAMADDDDFGRNRAETDDINRWTRNARFFIPGRENPIQIPWAFGMGAFAAAGAQLWAMGQGTGSVKDGLSNLLSITMDSFLPLPVSRINVFENPAAWALDSVLPSAIRPLFEWQMNMDALGREIYNNRQNRVGDAYSGGDNIPEMYKWAARTLADVTGGAVDWSPNTLYFFANNYADGFARIGQAATNWGLVATMQKDFDAKNDTLLLSGFIGTPSNFDAREFAAVEKQIKEKERRLNMFKTGNPEKYYEYLAENPMDQSIVDAFNRNVGGPLNRLREQANNYRRMPGLTVQERNDLVKSSVMLQNIIKRGLVDRMKIYDIEP